MDPSLRCIGVWMPMHRCRPLTQLDEFDAALWVGRARIFSASEPRGPRQNISELVLSRGRQIALLIQFYSSYALFLFVLSVLLLELCLSSVLVFNPSDASPKPHEENRIPMLP